MSMNVALFPLDPLRKLVVELKTRFVWIRFKIRFWLISKILRLKVHPSNIPHCKVQRYEVTCCAPRTITDAVLMCYVTLFWYKMRVSNNEKTYRAYSKTSPCLYGTIRINRIRRRGYAKNSGVVKYIVRYLGQIAESFPCKDWFNQVCFFYSLLRKW